VDIVEVIKSGLSRSGLSAAEASRRAFGNPYFVYGILKKGHTPSVENFEALCRVLDIDIQLRIVGEESVEGSALVPPEILRSLDLSPTATVAEAVATIGALNATSPLWARLQSEIASSRETLGELLSRLPGAPKVIEFPAGEGKAVAVQELRTAAGAGAESLEEPPIGYAYFRTSWLRKHGLNVDRCRIISVIGDSMEPTLLDGCTILLDRDRTDPRDGGIFVVNGSDGLIVKRLKREKGGEWILTSDNPAWPSIPWPAEARIVGRVAWSANTLL